MSVLYSGSPAVTQRHRAPALTHLRGCWDLSINESSAESMQPSASCHVTNKTTSCGRNTFSHVLTGSFVDNLVKKSLSPNRLITYIKRREPSVDNLPSGKEKVPQIELGTDYSGRKQQLENILKSDSFKAVFRDTRQMHFFFQVSFY